VIAAVLVNLLCSCSLATSIQRDAPINLLALSTINGSIPLQAGLSAGSTYQAITAAACSHQVTGAVTPTAQATASPTWSMASLNTQGFALNIIQPISPMYIVSKWSSGLNREFLLRLFIKSVHLPRSPSLRRNSIPGPRRGGVAAGACGQSELVLPACTEGENAKFSGTYSHVEWRSIAEVSNYLGALLRNVSAGQWTDTDLSGSAMRHTLFELSSDAKQGFTQVRYREQIYTIRGDDLRDATVPRNHSLQALLLLNELVSAAKVSSDIPNTQEIQFVPWLLHGPAPSRRT
jgi:hypothetical protein